MAKTLPLIPRKFFKRNGKVDLWDVLIEDGPVKIEFTPILAREALGRDKDRYKLELPRGAKPGTLQIEADERAAEAAADAAQEAPDPVYGRMPS